MTLIGEPTFIERELTVIEKSVMSRARKTLTVIHENSSFPVAKAILIDSCGLFADNTDLLSSASYTVQSHVPPDVWSEFVQKLEDPSTIEITSEKLPFFAELAKEFQVEPLLSACELFQGTGVFSPIDEVFKLHQRISALEARLAESERANEIAERTNEDLRAERQKLNDSLSRYRTEMTAKVKMLREQAKKSRATGKHGTDGAKVNNILKGLRGELEAARGEAADLERQIAEMRAAIEAGAQTLDSLRGE